jgi:hypothetical protein
MAAFMTTFSTGVRKPHKLLLSKYGSYWNRLTSMIFWNKVKVRSCPFQFCVLAVLFMLALPPVFAQADRSADGFRRQFANPPDDCRIMMRWWWFGPAVTKPEINHELEQMKAAGIGGVEIANLYALALDDPRTGFHNQPYLSDEHIEMLRYAAEEAKSLGLRVDVTLGSGWPLGGPHISVTQAAGLLRVETAKVPDHGASVALPYISSGEELMAAFVVPSSMEDTSFKDAKQISLNHGTHEARLRVPESLQGEYSVLFFISSRTGMVVKRPSVGAAGFVLDHYDKSATDTHLHAVGDRLLQAFGSQPPYAVFSDSLEDYGSNWTGDFLKEFQARRGYDLMPYLPALLGDAGPQTAAVRHDWGRTLTELANEHFLVPMRDWAHQNHTLLRSQTYGFPPVTLSSNQYIDLPEGEGKADLRMWRHFSDLRWAASAGHLFGSNVISSETWTWLHSPAFRATPLDMKAEADLHFLQGINQLVGHGWPYSPQPVGEPGWRMYAAGAFNDHNPWSFAMPDLTRYLQRVSFALRQGKPANEVAVLLPNDDAWAKFQSSPHLVGAVTTGLGFNTTGSLFSIDEAMDGLLGQVLLPQILDARFNVDFIDADAIDKVGIKYRVLILPGVERLPVATFRKIDEFARDGGIVIATRSAPSTAPGLMNANADTVEIRAISDKLFHGDTAPGHLLAKENELGSLLTKLVQPEVVFSAPSAEIGTIHRILPSGELYFIANTSNHAQEITASFQSSYHTAEVWDAMTGDVHSLGNPSNLKMHFEPYESRLVYLSNDSEPVRRGTVTPSKGSGRALEIGLGGNWTVDFTGLNRSVSLSQLHSWSDDTDFKYYSGRAEYFKTIPISASDLKSGSPLFLDFGEGTPVDVPSPLGEHSMRAYLESPVREAAEVFVNGQRAGVVWHPPYRVRIDQFLKPGANEFKIVVGNTAINSLAGQTLPDYRLLKDRHGDLFSPQDMNDLQPLPSGLLGSVQITTDTSN